MSRRLISNALDFRRRTSNSITGLQRRQLNLLTDRRPIAIGHINLHDRDVILQTDIAQGKTGYK